MARKAPVTAFTSDRGSRYLFLNGSGVRDAYSRWAGNHKATDLPQSLANFAKVALIRRAVDGPIELAVKPSATSAYTTIRIDGAGAAWALHDMLQDSGMRSGVCGIVRNAVLGERIPDVEKQFDDLFAILKRDQEQDQEQEQEQEQPKPQPKPQERRPDAERAPQGAPNGAGLLDAFGDFGKAINGAIVTVVERAIADLPKGGNAVTVTVPGYTPVTLPDGEVMHEEFPALLLRCTAQKPKDRNVLLVGARGSGKTHAAEQVARSLGLAFDAVSMSGGTTERAFWGTTTIRDGNMVWKPSRFVEMFRAGGVFLIDELDKADPTVVTALNMATSNGYICPVDSDERIVRHDQFIVVAGANALASDRAYTGSTRLDASSLDRFAIMRWDYSPAITARVAAECGDARAADWIVRLTDAMRARIESKGWRGEVEWGTRTVARVASWIRAGQSRAQAVAMETGAMAPNVRAELEQVARSTV
jgi:MoxR-like ATPase